MEGLYKEEWLLNKRGQKLFTVSYMPPSGHIKTIVLWHHGYGEHVGRYVEFFTKLAEKGYAVYSFDAHSHGRSEPSEEKDKCFITEFKHFVDDVYFLVDHIKKQHEPAVHLILGGNSMGGLVAATAVLRNQAMWSGLILSSAALDVEWTLVLRIQKPFGSLLAALAPRARIVPAVRLEDMSQDPKVLKEYQEDKLNFLGNVRAKTASVLLQAFTSLKSHYHEFSLPIYAMHGDTDRCTSLPAVELFMQKVSSSDKTLEIVKGGYHEILLGPEKVDVMNNVLKWLDAHAPQDSKI